MVNDVHSRLNPTPVAGLVELDSLQAITETLEKASRAGRRVCVAGGRHAMGSQQFATDAVLLDTSRLNRILSFDTASGLLEAEAGALWPDLIRNYVALQEGVERPWGILQKQTGADRLSLGGAVSANAHGRSLTRPPIVGDVESLTIVTADGRVRRASRNEEADLFRLAVGGYGLLGVIYSVTLRLAPRQKVVRVVDILGADELAAAFEERIAAGFAYGDFQFAIDEASTDFLQKGVFSCYRAVDPDTPLPSERRELCADDWRRLIHLAHTQKSEGFRQYAAHYLSTSGQVYWSDTHQLGVYVDHYHDEIDGKVYGGRRGSEVITEAYVPRQELASFLSEVRDDFRRHAVNLIYGTVRLIERDDETFLPWARDRYACIVFNLHTEHTPHSVEQTADSFRRLYDMATRRGGSFYLTYGKHATAGQVEACYPRFREFLRKKAEWDPRGLFASDWHRHYARLFS